jgi:hypothetical protein
MSAVARGIAEADSVGNAANVQAATPISNKRFIFTVSLEPHHRGQGGNVPGTNEFHFSSRGMRRIQPDARPDESGFLGAFDCNHDLICAAAAKVYVRGSRGSYDLVAAHF